MNSQLHFEEMGFGPAIVFVAGLGGEGRFWSRQMAHFANTHRVICYDHRGCGRSMATKPNRSIEAMSADLEVLLCELNVEHAIVVGHSTGGAIAQVLATDRPDLVSRVVLSSTWLRADDYMRDLFRLRLDVMRTMGATTYAALGKILCYGPYRPTAEPTDAASPQHVAIATPARMPIDFDTVSSRIEALLAFDGSSRARRLQQPMLIVGARDDMITPAYLWAELGDAYPQAISRLVEYGGHFCPQTITDTYNTILGEFIRS